MGDTRKFKGDSRQLGPEKEFYPTKRRNRRLSQHLFGGLCGERNQRCFEISNAISKS